MPAEPRRLLILGGTAEAALLTGRAAESFAGRMEVITSLAGRLASRPELAGRLQVGGFGGSEGLARYLRQEAIAWVVDATHPFAAEITAHGIAACLREGVPHLMLLRPPWSLPSGGNWIEVDDLEAAAALLPRLGRRVFLTVGRSGLEAFSGCDDVWFLVRLIEDLGALPLADYQAVTGRPPFILEDERALLAEHRIQCLVSKHSGGDATLAKIIAASEAGIPVLLVRRPFVPPGEAVDDVDGAMAWLGQRL